VQTATRDQESKKNALSAGHWQAKIGERRFQDPLAFSYARILLVATLLGAPLAFGAVVPWAWAALGLAAGLALTLWAVGCVQQGVLELTWSPLYVPLALFFLLAAGQYAAGFTLEWSETRQALILLAEDLIFFFLAQQLFSGAGSGALRAFGVAVLSFAGAMGLFAILQFAAGTHRIYGIVGTPSGGLFGSYVNPDHFAGLMEMTVPVAILYLAGHRKRAALGTAALRVFAVTLAVASLMLTGSRGGLLAVLAEVAIAAVVLRRARTQTFEARRLAVGAALALLSGVMLFAYVGWGGAAQRLGSVGNVSKTWADWAGQRRSMTVDTLRMWRDHPLLGIGLGDFEIAYPLYQSLPSDDYIEHAHDDYVEALAETGLLGGLLIVWALAAFFYAAFRGWGQPFQAQGNWTRLGAAIGCCGLLLHSLWDFNLHIPANAAWFSVLAGIAAARQTSLTSQGAD